MPRMLGPLHMEFYHITSRGNARFQYFSIHHEKSDSDVCSPLISNVIDTRIPGSVYIIASFLPEIGILSPE